MKVYSKGTDMGEFDLFYVSEICLPPVCEYAA